MHPYIIVTCHLVLFCSMGLPVVTRYYIRLVFGMCRTSNVVRCYTLLLVVKGGRNALLLLYRVDLPETTLCTRHIELNQNHNLG